MLGIASDGLDHFLIIGLICLSQNTSLIPSRHGLARAQTSPITSTPIISTTMNGACTAGHVQFGSLHTVAMVWPRSVSTVLTQRTLSQLSWTGRTLRTVPLVMGSTPAAGLLPKPTCTRSSVGSTWASREKSQSTRLIAAILWLRMGRHLPLSTRSFGSRRPVTESLLGNGLMDTSPLRLSLMLWLRSTPGGRRSQILMAPFLPYPLL
mmetsp:Transcript_59709/g.129335  ORF Transcript_59709/g.129335 Transcript_59709/m.129335 type:complete len:208 (-) Transcript_59709:260-883(-)